MKSTKAFISLKIGKIKMHTSIVVCFFTFRTDDIYTAADRNNELGILKIGNGPVYSIIDCTLTTAWKKLFAILFGNMKR